MMSSTARRGRGLSYSCRISFLESRGVGWNDSTLCQAGRPEARTSPRKVLSVGSRLLSAGETLMDGPFKTFRLAIERASRAGAVPELSKSFQWDAGEVVQTRNFVRRPSSSGSGDLLEAERRRRTSPERFSSTRGRRRRQVSTYFAADVQFSFAKLRASVGSYGTSRGHTARTCFAPYEGVKSTPARLPCVCRCRIAVAMRTWRGRRVEASSPCRPRVTSPARTTDRPTRPRGRLAVSIFETLERAS